jgi:hypothetical protein
MCLHETKSCGRCNSSFECKVGNIAQCHCSGITLTGEERQFIAGHYTDCLCGDCLMAIRNEIKTRPARGKIDLLQAISKTR